MKHSERTETRAERPTPLFLGCIARPVVRFALLAFAAWLFVSDPAALDASSTFGVAGGVRSEGNQAKLVRAILRAEA